jgi:peptidoglycan/xylan/chitin deacetylase (PgdA/CDA1 family)
VINPMVKKALMKSNYTVIGYSNRLWDTVAKKHEKVLKRFRSQLQPGDIVLLHDTSPLTSRILAELIRYTKQSGFAVVPLDELLNILPYDKS